MFNSRKFSDFIESSDIGVTRINTPEELLELAANDKIKLAQLKALIKIHPGIVQASIEAIQSIGKVSEAASHTQSESIKSIKESIYGTIEVMKTLAKNAQSDSARERIAELLIELSKQHKEVSLIVERMNENNNSLWKKVVLGIGGAAMIVIGGVATAATIRK